MASKKTSVPEVEVRAPEVAEASVEQPAPVVPASAPPAPANEISGLPRVGLDVFVQVCGLKPDQVAGFRAWARSRKLPAQTVPEWHLALKDFANRPV